MKIIRIQLIKFFFSLINFADILFNLLTPSLYLSLCLSSSLLYFLRFLSSISHAQLQFQFHFESSLAQTSPSPCLSRSVLNTLQVILTTTLSLSLSSNFPSLSHIVIYVYVFFSLPNEAHKFWREQLSL